MFNLALLNEFFNNKAQNESSRPTLDKFTIDNKCLGNGGKWRIYDNEI